MRSLSRISCIFLLVFIFNVNSSSADKYTSKFNNVDLNAIMKNDRLLNAYFKCLMSGKGCTPDGEELKKVIPEVLEDGCAKCSKEQIAGAKKMANFLIKNKPDMFKQLLQKFDPDRKYRKKWEVQLKEEGFDPNSF